MAEALAAAVSIALTTTFGLVAACGVIRRQRHALDRLAHLLVCSRKAHAELQAHMHQSCIVAARVRSERPRATQVLH